jgi:hypothetical protein
MEALRLHLHQMTNHDPSILAPHAKVLIVFDLKDKTGKI